MKNKIKRKRILAISMDLLWSILAMVILNATIQLVLYPQLHVRMNDAPFGDMLTLLSVVSIIATSFGSAANYARMFASTKNKAYSSDYLNYLFLTSLVCFPVLLIVLKTINDLSIRTAILFGLLTLVSLLRYYGDVEYRLCLDYHKYFFYYFCMATTYVFSLIVFKQAAQWYYILILGEMGAICFAATTSPLFRGYTLAPTEFFRTNSIGWIQLSLSNLISAIVLNADRIIIRYLVGSEAVTVFYVATLLGKVVAMVGTPMNGVLIGYITKYKNQIKKKTVLLMEGISMVTVPILGLCCVLGTKIIIPVLYPNVLDSNYFFVLIACLGQVLYFISNTLMVFIMQMYGEQMALWISIGYGVIFFAVAIPMVFSFRLMGMAYAILIVNAIKMGAIVLLSHFSMDVC